MKVYLVGGAVRDEIMGIEPKDKDYVVVGATPAEMFNKGFKQVGADFPVFLHPETGDEYALARTERKNGEGYQAFDCYFGTDVTLMDDLRRRDLTINAIAKDMETGEYIDYFGGIADISNGILREVSEHFYEDPLRVLRVARFLARFEKFEVAPTLYLMCNNANKELPYLTPERVWKEVDKALDEPAPERFFGFMYGRGVFTELDDLARVEQPVKWHPEGNAFVHTLMVLKAAKGYDKLTKFGALCHDLGKWPTYREFGNTHGHEEVGVGVIEDFCSRLRIPNEYKRVAKVASKWHTHIHKGMYMKPTTVHKAIKGAGRDFFRLLDVATADKMGRGAPCCDWSYIQPTYMKVCHRAMMSIDRKVITSSMEPGPKVGEAIRQAELKAIRGVDKSLFTNRFGDN